MSIADKMLVKLKKYNPYSYDPSDLSTEPIAKGPRNPPKLPIELIIPTLPAAAEEVRNRLGNDQNAGM